MKTILKSVLFACAAVLGVACNNIIESEESLLFPETEIILTATREGLAPATRSFRLDDGSVWWNPAEEVSVFYGSGSNGGSKFVSMNTAIAETVELQGSVQMAGSGKDFWAVYPYSEDNSCDGSSIITVIPDKQGGIEGNFSDNTFPAVAKSSSLSLAFWNICGGIKFFVSRNDIKSVTFKGNNGEALAGKVKIAFDASGIPVVAEVIDGKSEITITALEGGTFKAGKYYYLTLLPTALDSGFTMTFNTDNQEGSFVSNNSQTIKRSIFGVLKNIDSKVVTWETTWVEPEWVDLGLPSGIKWATFNVGVTKTDEYGNYFAWGETGPSSNYSQSTYKWYLDGDSTPNPTITKYCIDSFRWGGSGPVDYKTVLDPEDDAAHVNWGGCWRMPTEAEWTELRTKCTWTWTIQNGVYGRLVTGPNGASIFLPAAGERHGTLLYDAGSYGYYWSSSLLLPYFAWAVDFDSDGVVRDGFVRFRGCTVRAVYDDRIHPESVSLNKTVLSLKVNDSEQLTATVLPDNATVKSVVWTSDNTEVATVDDQGIVTALKAGTATITATTVDGAKTAICEVTVVELPKPEAVDLGLPSGIKWATFNVGATKPEEYGDYFAWGETEPKDDYSWSNYKWRSSGDSIENVKFSKYNTISSWGVVDNTTVLYPEDDAAHVNWGGNWRMPSDAEWTELRENCSWVTTNNYKGTGVAGRIVTSNISGYTDKSIFLPSAGGRGNKKYYYVGTESYYWSLSLIAESPYYGWSVFCLSSQVVRAGGDRSFGFSVRPVYDDRIYPESVSLNKSTLSLYVGDSEQLTATVLPDNATVKSVVWSSDNAEVATVDEAGNVKALKAGTAIITATTVDGGKTATCELTVKSLSMPASVEAIDLGLPSGLKWASMNVGATKPEEYGAYFAWGETEPKSNYSWSTYKWFNGSSYTQTKYNTDSSYGTVDNKTVLDPEDDAAHVNWSGNWRMPTDAEWTELRTKCTWTWTSQNGVNGRLGTGPNGKSIFLPAAGDRDGAYLSYAGSIGYYWSSSLYTDYPNDAWHVYFNSGYVYRYNTYRYYGFSVRPVSE